MILRSIWSIRRAIPLLCLAGCGGTGAVEYVDGKCVIGGVVSTLAQVETRQAALTQHILARQPVLTAIAVAAVVLASASYVQRLLTVLAARRASATTFSDRVRTRMERYRAHPLRYFSILGATLAILVVAGASYIELDADKRTSERALTTLQFCHLALRTADEQRVLTQQRDNLASIQTTAGDIRALVDKLPPAEQQKAHEIVDTLTTSLGQQRALVTRYAFQADESARAVQERQADVARGLSKLDSDVGTLKAVPTELDRIDGSLRDLGARGDDVGVTLLAYKTRLDAIDRTMSELASRPVPACPACNCSAPMITSASPAATAATLVIDAHSPPMIRATTSSTGAPAGQATVTPPPAHPTAIAGGSAAPTPSLSSANAPAASHSATASL